MQINNTHIVLAGLMLVASGCPDSGSGDDDGSTGQATGAASSSGPTAVDTSAGTPTPPATQDDTGGTAGSSDGGNTSTGSADDTSGDSGDTGDSGDSTGDDESSGSTGEKLEPIDCDLAPTEAVSTQIIPNARGYHGLAITPDGRIIGSDGASLLAVTYGGDVQVFIPGADIGQQMDWLPDGDIAFVGNNSLLRLGLKGTSEVITGTSGAYGVSIGPDGMAYVVGWDGMVRVDPITGDQEILFTESGESLHSMGFSPDWSRAYIGTVGGSGTIYYVDFDAGMNLLTGLEVFTTGVGNGSNWHDAVGVDACGNLYVPDYWSSNMYRVTPAGDSAVFWDPPSSNLYGHGAVWGTGEHGWVADALYVPQPYNNNTVGEVVVGVPWSKYEGPVINAVPMRP